MTTGRSESETGPGPISEVLGALIGGDVVFSRENLANVLSEQGWVQVSSSKWGKEGQLALILSEGEESFVELVFRLIPPRDDSPEYVGAIEEEYAHETLEMKHVAQSVVSALSAGGAHLAPTADACPDESANFVEPQCWSVGDFHLSMGVAHADETVPILLMARLRRGWDDPV